MSEIKPVAYMFDWQCQKDELSISNPHSLELKGVVSVGNIRPLCFLAGYEALAKKLEISETSKLLELERLQERDFHVSKQLEEISETLNKGYSIAPHVLIQSVAVAVSKLQRSRKTSGLTVQDKARIFDELVKICEGRHRCIGVKRKVGKTVVDYSLDSAVAHVDNIPVFEWIIRANGESSFETALTTLIKR